jgi:hypothetical protein
LARSGIRRTVRSTTSADTRRRRRGDVGMTLTPDGRVVYVSKHKRCHRDFG